MRLNQYLASILGIGRRQADTLIQNSSVEVDGGIPVLGQKLLGGEKIRVFQKNQWQDKGIFEVYSEENSQSKVLLFYKPIFCVCTKFDPQGRKTVYDILPKFYHNYKYAGRLDYMSEGLVVFATDGNLIESLTHPRFGCQKVYLVGLKKSLGSEFVRAAKNGLEIEEETGIYKLNPVIIRAVDDSRFEDYAFLKIEDNLFWYEFELWEGRNQQIRKMVEIANNQVIRLVRVRHGDYILDSELKTKKWLFVDNKSFNSI